MYGRQCRFLLNTAENTPRFSISDTQGGTQDDTTEESSQKTTEKIMLAIQNNPRITYRELAELLGLTEDGIFWNIKKLKAKGFLRRVGPNKGGHWKKISTDR